MSCASPDPLHVLIVATYRDTDVGRGHPLAELLADVPASKSAERLFLSGLDVPGVIAFMEEAAGHNLDDEGIATGAGHLAGDGGQCLLRGRGAPPS